MKEQYVVALLLVSITLLLGYEATTLSISAHEIQGLNARASLYYKGIYLLWQNVHSELALRATSIFLHVANALLFYALSLRYLQKYSDRIYLFFIFLLLPGVNSSAVLLDPAIFYLFLLLAYLVIVPYVERFRALLMLGLLLLSKVFLILMFAEIFYAIVARNKQLLFAAITFFTMGMYWYGVDPGGIPQGHFLDLFGGYMAVFSPFIWLYLLYAIYRTQITDAHDEVHMIALTAILLSFFLSIRQNIHVEVFAPFVIPALLIAAKVFSYSYHVRLPEFRLVYRAGLSVAMLFLVINALLVFFNPLLYLVLDNPKEHFAYRNHIAKELAQSLKVHHIKCVTTDDGQLQERLAFYDIAQCENHQLLAAKVHQSDINVTICYMKKPIFRSFVTK